MNVNDQELKQVAWKVLRGWVVESYGERERQEIIREMLKVKNVFDGVELAEAQLHSLKITRQKVTYKMFCEEVALTRRIARQVGLSDLAVYDLFMMAAADFMLLQVYGEVTTFANEEYSEEKRLDMAFRFALGVVDSSLKPDFRRMMSNKERAAIALARSRGKSVGEILEIIARSNDEAMSFGQFKRDLSTAIRIFKLGGIADEQQAYRYFKLLLAHVFYRLGANG